jgi:hypothetical protein
VTGASGSRGEIVSVHGVELIPVADALLREPDLRFVATLPVLGITTRFETNSPTVLGIVEDAFGAWGTLGALADVDERACRIRVVVTAGDEGQPLGSAHAMVRHISPDDGRLIAHSPGSVAISDPARRDAVAYVSSALVADAAHFRAELLEATTLALLSELDRHPVHAAAVAKDGRAALFAATSGTGKSTLAYLCHAAGCALMSEDRVYLQLEPSPRVWGWPSAVRLVPDVAARLGAGDTDVRVQRRGRNKVEIDASSGMNRERLTTSDFVACVLTRDGGPAALEPLSPDALASALSEQLAPGFDRFPERWPAALRALVGRGGWRLNLSSDPREAVPLVHDVLRRATA